MYGSSKPKMTSAVMATLSMMALALPCFAATTLHLTHRTRNDMKPQLLKPLRDACRITKQSMQNMRRENPAAFAELLRGVKKDQPNYDIDRPLAPEPDWSKIAIVAEEEEYFDGNRYALYQRAIDYKLSEDGACGLRETVAETVTIDDGKSIYDIDLLARTGTRRASAAGAGGYRPPGAAMGTLDLRDAARGVQSLAAKSGQERIAGESCTMTTVAFLGKNTKVCFWSVSPEHAGTKRPVTLKTIVPLGRTATVREVVQFRKPARIEPRIFTPPANVTWRNG